MSSTTSQDQWYKFLNDSLNADSELSNDDRAEQQQTQQEQEQYAEVNAQIQATLDQAKTSAMEAGANLIGIGGIEGIRAVKGLYTSGKSLYTRVQQMKDISQKLIAQKAEKTAKIEQLKEQKFNEAQASNAEIDPLTGQAKGPILDRDQFMADADSAISKASRDAVITQVRGAVADRLQPFIDNATSRATNIIDAIGSQVEGGVTRLTNTVSGAAKFVRDGFGQYTDTANQLKQDYLDTYNKARNWSDANLTKYAEAGKSKLSDFAESQRQAGIEGIDEHVSTISDLLNQGTRQSVAQASTLFKNLRENVKMVKPYNAIKDAQRSIDDTKVGLEQGKADVVNQLNETKANIQDKLDVSRGRLQRAQSLPENAKEFQNAGTTKSEALDSIQKDIDGHNFDLDNAINDTSRRIGDLETTATGKIADLQNTISARGQDIIDAAGGATSDILTRINRSTASAISTTGDAISNVRSSLAPITDTLGTLMTPVAVWQGALSAENLVTGVDRGNLEAIANDAVNVRFGVGAAKQGVTAVGQKISSLIGGNEQQTSQAVNEARTATNDVAQTSARQAEAQSTNFADQIGKSAGTSAGEDIAAGLAEGGVEEVAEVGLGDLALNAIPVVGEIADVGLAAFSVFEGIKSLFHHDSTPDIPPPPPPPPMVTSSVSFAGQAGVY